MTTPIYSQDALPQDSYRLWISTPWVTSAVTVKDEVIEEAPPIWKKFRGQKVRNLLQWLCRNSNDIQWKVLPYPS